MRLQDVMTTPVMTTTPDTSAQEAWEVLRAQRIQHLVVTENRRTVGVISAKDLGGRLGGRTREAATVADLMVPSAVTAPPDLHVRDAANLMRGRSIGCLPVVEGTKLVGIVTVSDLLGVLGRGAFRPVVRGKRWTLKHRGPRRRAVPMVGK
jgi:acetoin utilization protein AcuB